MKKKMKWYGMAMIFGFFMFFTNDVSAQQRVLNGTQDMKASTFQIQPSASTANDRVAQVLDVYNAVHSTNYTRSDLKQLIEPNQTNLDNWNMVLNVESNTNPAFITALITGIERGL